MTSFWVDSVKSLLLEFGGLSDPARRETGFMLSCISKEFPLKLIWMGLLEREA